MHLIIIQEKYSEFSLSKNRLTVKFHASVREKPVCKNYQKCRVGSCVKEKTQSKQFISSTKNQTGCGVCVCVCNLDLPSSQLI